MHTPRLVALAIASIVLVVLSVGSVSSQDRCWNSYLLEQPTGELEQTTWTPCGVTPTPTDTPEPTYTDTPVPTDTPTVTNTTVPTPTPTPTFIPTPTSTLIPTLVPTVIPTATTVISTSVGDDFERTTLGPNWTVVQNTFGILNGNLVSNSTGSCVLQRAQTFTTDQYSEAVLASGAPSQTNVFVRRNNVGQGYFFGYGGSQTYAIKRGNGGAMVMASGIVGIPVAGDTIRIEARGQDITGYVNGTAVVTTTDSQYTFGSIGIACGVSSQTTTPVQLINSWLGGWL